VARWLRLAVAVLAVLAGLASTTASIASAFSYDFPTVARVSAHSTALDSAPSKQVTDSGEWPAAPPATIRGASTISVARVVATNSAGQRQTTILGENVTDRVMPFATRTNSRTLGFGTTDAEWSAMSSKQRWRLNDGQLRARINEGDDFRYIGRDPYRDPASRQSFDLTRSELLRLDDRGIPYDEVSWQEVSKLLDQSG